MNVLAEMRRALPILRTTVNALVVLSLATRFPSVNPGVVEGTDANATWGNGSGDAVEERIRELRIEMVKFQILSKLNLKEPPQIEESPSNFSKEAVKLLLQETEEQTRQTPESQTRLVIPAEGDGMDCLETNSSSCKMFRHEFSSTLNTSSMYLWVYKLGDIPRRLSVSLTLYSTNEERNYDSFYFEVQQKAWTKLRLFSSILLPSSWNDTVQSYVQIIGRDVDYEGAHRPYLMSTRSLVPASRHRRDTECDASESCCKKPLRLSFADIGFNFIVYPEALEANMCVGKCRLDHSTLRTHYERALSTTIEKNSTLREILGECWTLCCKPKKLKEVRVIYKDLENLHHDQFIPELSVESCSCS